MLDNLPRYGFVKRAVSRFMPGEEVEAALVETKRLGAEGLTSMLTLLGENVYDATEAGQVTEHYQAVLDEIAKRDLPGQISVKPTHLGIDLGRDVVMRELDFLLDHAAKHDNVVWIDMEGSKYTQVTIDIFRDLYQRHRNVGLCLQAYLYRTEKDLEDLLPDAPAIRLVKGAYAESFDIAYPDKKDVDENFFKLSRRLLQCVDATGGTLPGFATHDMKLIRRIQHEAREQDVGPEKYEIQMLYGIATSIQRELIGEGESVRILISYGPSWFPWYMRRLAERPANLGFVLKSMVR